MAEVRPFWTGMPRARRSGARLRGCMGCPCRRPGNNQRASWLPAVTMFVRLQARLSNKSAKSAGTVAAGSPSQDNLVVDAADIVNGEADDAADWLGVEEQQETRDSFAHRHSMVRQQAAYQ